MNTCNKPKSIYNSLIVSMYVGMYVGMYVCMYICMHVMYVAPSLFQFDLFV